MVKRSSEIYNQYQSILIIQVKICRTKDDIWMLVLGLIHFVENKRMFKILYLQTFYLISVLIEVEDE